MFSGSCLDSVMVTVYVSTLIPTIEKYPLPSVLVEYTPVGDLASTAAAAIGACVVESVTVPLRLPYKPPAAYAGVHNEIMKPNARNANKSLRPIGSSNIRAEPCRPSALRDPLPIVSATRKAFRTG